MGAEVDPPARTCGHPSKSSRSCRREKKKNENKEKKYSNDTDTQKRGGCLSNVWDSNRRNSGLSFRTGRAPRSLATREGTRRFPPRIARRKCRRGHPGHHRGNRTRRCRTANGQTKTISGGCAYPLSKMSPTFVRSITSIRHSLRPTIVVALSLCSTATLLRSRIRIGGDSIVRIAPRRAIGQLARA